MGYTHYYTRDCEVYKKEVWEQLKDDLRSIINTSDVNVEADIEEDVIIVNADEMSETFVIYRHLDDGWGHDKSFSFCKTRRLPYDEVVASALISLEDLTETNVKSDGDFTNDSWRRAVKLWKEAVGRQLPLKFESIKSETKLREFAIKYINDHDDLADEFIKYVIQRMDPSNIRSEILRHGGDSVLEDLKSKEIL